MTKPPCLQLAQCMFIVKGVSANAVGGEMFWPLAKGIYISCKLHYKTQSYEG